MFNQSNGEHFPKKNNIENAETQIATIKTLVEENAQRVAKLGTWPTHIEVGSLAERIPQEGDNNAAGFDAGLACAMNLIPPEMQKLSAKLHANYSRETVLQIIEEIESENPDTETVWWLLACHYCEEGGIDQKTFLEQVEAFKLAAADPEKRLAEAKTEYNHMTSNFELKDGVPYSEKDGGMQGAYISGYTYAVQYSDKYNIYFIGTCEPSLGLENFEWSETNDEEGRSQSGPVFGSSQFVKCANKDELNRALLEIKKHLPLKRQTFKNESSN